MHRIDRLLLSAVGVLIVHQIAYTASSMAGADSAVGHGHLAQAWWFASLAALVALARSIARSLKRRAHNPGNELSLFGWIASGYLLLEQGERLVDGLPATALFTEPVFWIGLAAAPLVALALHRSIRSVEVIVEALVTVANRATWPVVRVLTPASQPLEVRIAAGYHPRSRPRRGPPR